MCLPKKNAAINISIIVYFVTFSYDNNVIVPNRLFVRSGPIKTAAFNSKIFLSIDRSNQSTSEGCSQGGVVSAPLLLLLLLHHGAAAAAALAPSVAAVVALKNKSNV